MKPALALALAVLLAACGADGAPQPPAGRPAPGLSITGTLELGIRG